MRLTTVRINTAEGTTLRPARIDGDDLVLLEAPDLMSAARLGGSAVETGERLALAEASLAPVVPNPAKVICVGVNYQDHIDEMGRQAPSAPTYFAKFARSLIGPNDDIVLPSPNISTNIDWECELAVVIGAEARNVSPANALDYVAGYTVLNDVSVRDYQRRTTQFLAGKMFEGLTPVGPVLVPVAELGDGSGLAISTTVNGEVKQQSSTSHLVFDVPHILSDLSQIITLEPGDIIATGTPGGVGAARNPPQWLVDGDEMVTEIEGIGRLVNRCRLP